MKTYILYIVFLVNAVSALGQKPYIVLEVNPQEAVVGELFTITVKTNISSNISIDFPACFSHGYNVMNGMEQQTDFNTGKSVTVYLLSQNGMVNKPGTFKIGPATVKKGGKTYTSNSITIEVKKEQETKTSESEANFTKKQLRQPAFGIVEKNKAIMYEGEPLVLNARVYARFNPTHLEDYQTFGFPGAIDKHDLQHSSNIMVEETRLKNHEFYTFAYDKKVMFPAGTGKKHIEPFKLILRDGFDGIAITSAVSTVEIKPLPANAPKSFNGGVGHFSISSQFDKNKIKQGEVATLKVSIEGTGNLQNITRPNLILPKGMELYGDPVIHEKISYSEKGAEGSVTYEFNIRMTKEGNLTIPAIKIAYFDPEKEKYVTETSVITPIEVKHNPAFLAADTIQAYNPQQLVNEDVFPMRRDAGNSAPSFFIYKNPGFWMGLTTPFALAFFSVFLWKRKEENKSLQLERVESVHAKNEIKHLLNDAQFALEKNQVNTGIEKLEKAILTAIELDCKVSNLKTCSQADICTILKHNNLNEQQVEHVKLLLNKFQQAKYGWGIPASEQESMLTSTKEVIQTIIHN